MIKILIVEDERPIASLLKMSLTRAGYTVTCVYDGMSAADLLENDRFDLILLDIMLRKPLANAPSRNQSQQCNDRKYQLILSDLNGTAEIKVIERIKRI